MITLPISPAQNCWVIFPDDPEDSIWGPCKAVAFLSLDNGGDRDLEVVQVCVISPSQIGWFDESCVYFEESKAREMLFHRTAKRGDGFAWDGSRWQPTTA